MQRSVFAPHRVQELDDRVIVRIDPHLRVEAELGSEKAVDLGNRDGSDDDALAVLAHSRPAPASVYWSVEGSPPPRRLRAIRWPCIQFFTVWMCPWRRSEERRVGKEWVRM